MSKKRHKNYKHERRIIFTVALLLTGIFIGKYQPYDSLQLVPKRVVSAEERWVVAGSSTVTEASKVSNLEHIFTKYNSPLVGQAAFFVDLSHRYSLDYRLLPAIAFSESSLCKHYVVETNNCFGWGPHHTFSSFEEAEETVARGITTIAYYRRWQADRGDVYKLGSVYNPSDGTDYWVKKVSGFMEEIEQ